MEKNWVVLDTEIVVLISTGHKEHTIVTMVYGPYQEAEALDVAIELNQDGQTTAHAMEMSNALPTR